MTQSNYKAVFWGTPEFAVPTLERLIASSQFDVVAVVTQADKPVGKKQILTPSPIKETAIKHGIPVLQPLKVKNNTEFLTELKSYGADINVVVAYGKILPQEILDSAKYGSVNVHGSELPKYRGASPIQAAILNGDTETRVTIQKMVLEMDEGPIISMGKAMQIEPMDTYETLGKKLAVSAAEAIEPALLDYLNGTEPTPQDNAKASYVKLIHKEDGQIDWHQNEDRIERMVRAYYPWPTAFTTLGDTQVKILEAEYKPEVDNPKGRISKIDKNLFVGKLWIKTLQPAGKQPMSGSAFLNGYQKYIGMSVI